MITINDLTPDALRFEGLTDAEVTALLGATADIVPREGPEQPVPTPDAGSPVRAQGRVTWGPGFVVFDRLSADEAAKISAAFRRLQGGPA
jgi:hypothetical protein